MNFSRSNILRAVAILWVVGVSAYFVYDIYQGIRYGLYQNGVNQGYASAVNELVSKVSGKCDAPTPINVGDKKIEIVDVACLKAPPQSSNTGATQPQPQAPAPAPQAR